MDKRALYKILQETTAIFRKGEVVHGDAELVEAINAAQASGRPFDPDNLPGGTVTIDMMPPISAAADGLTMIDVEFMVVGVEPAAAERNRAALTALLDTYPEPERLAGGPSYIEIGAVIGSQEMAFRLFALGGVLKLWEVITPQRLGIHGEDASKLAGRGFIMMSGYRSSEPEVQPSP